MSDAGDNQASSRAVVLQRIREAQRLPTVPEVRHGIGAPERQNQCSGLPYVAPDAASMRAALAARCAALKARLIMVESVAAMSSAVASILAQKPDARLAAAPHPVVDPIVARLQRPALLVNERTDRAALAACDIGITSCYALIAQTGSVMITAHATAGRAISILPPHHIVLATPAQLLPDLPAAYARFAADPARGTTSMFSLISGPSRTGDIERILVLGVHGPRELTIILGP
jgi:L-lactate dehydrogenase complex protein LldG